MEVSSVKALDEDLKSDIQLLGKTLGDVVREIEGDAFFTLLEETRLMSVGSRKQEKTSFNELTKSLLLCTPLEKYKLSKAFTEFLRLSNLAEQVHRAHKRKQVLSPLSEKVTLASTFQKLLDKGVSKKKIVETLESLKIELIFTSHPTEAVLPHTLERHRQVSEILLQLKDKELGDFQRIKLHLDLKRYVTTLWLSGVVSEDKPTPEQEAAMGPVLVKEVLWNAVPDFLNEVDISAETILETKLKHTFCPFSFGSWMGGDRDGNPHVTADVTDKIISSNIYAFVSLIREDLIAIQQELSLLNSHSHEDLNKKCQSELQSFITLFEEALVNAKSSGVSKNLLPVESKKVFKTLEGIAEALEKENLKILSEGKLRNTLRRLKAFKMSLLPLEIRQSADIHEEIVAAYFAHEKMAYSDLTESQREKHLSAFIEKLLNSDQNFRSKLIPKEQLSLSVEALETIKTLEKLEPYPRETFGTYIISMCESVSDVLEAIFVILYASKNLRLPIVPLFETPASLEASEKTLDSLFALDFYKKWSNSNQEVMLGYSDSAKRSGRLTSSWQIYKLQNAILSVAKKHSFNLFFFHGRGGSVARGGGPIQVALLSLPRPHVPERIKITEQGESIHANFALPEIAKRTLELYFCGFLEARLTEEASLPVEWQQRMEKISTLSTKSFRESIYEDAFFMEYFKTTTPADELRLLKIGSRPQARKKELSFDNLRAIPWVFAWTQNRSILPSWMGVAKALIAFNDMSELQEMYKNWSFFRSNVDLTEFAVAKADAMVFSFYSDFLSQEHPRKEDIYNKTKSIILEHDECLAVVHKISHSEMPFSKRSVLSQSIAVRNPYVDVLNVLQVLLLKEYRSGTTDPLVEGALGVTIAGIAAGMRSTG